MGFGLAPTLAIADTIASLDEAGRTRTAADETRLRTDCGDPRHKGLRVRPAASARRLPALAELLAVDDGSGFLAGENDVVASF
ncbi:MAG: hypothetical protein WD181_05115 [Solirubrobacterales bacterium]